MKRQTLWRISVSTSAEAEDAVAEMLERVFRCPAAIHTDLRTRRTTVSIFSKADPIALAKNRIELRKALVGLKLSGLTSGSARICMKIIPHENWANSWKRHFKPIEVGDALLVKPSWSTQTAKRR